VQIALLLGSTFWVSINALLLAMCRTAALGDTIWVTDD